MIKTVAEIKVGDKFIKNVKRGFEWVPGPYGAFIVQGVSRSEDEVTLHFIEASGCGPVHAMAFDCGEKLETY
jgi:hypothetical protein